ncbi:MAG: FAD:protein FMN transferase [Emticicia sp.]|nr:FAD:protein FMN transferase [Emticicia sp.]
MKKCLKCLFRLTFLQILYGVGIVWGLGSCKNDDYEKLTGKAQGTTYAITFKKSDSKISKNEVDSIFKVIDRSMSLWDSTSTITAFNKTEAKMEVDGHFQKVLQKSFEIHQQSEGVFDPTVGPLIKAWGFINKGSLPIPNDASIDSLKRFVGLEKIKLIGNIVSKTYAGIQLDFNAIAQGYTVDVLAEFLENKKVQDYLIEVGGEVRTKGFNSENKSWKVGIEKPTLNETDETNALQTVLNLNNISLATSGNYRNYIENKGKKFGHIINPKTGKAVEHQVVSVSVLAGTCAEADAWATAFTVMGKEKSMLFAKKLGFEIQIISWQKDSNNFEVFQSEGFKKTIQ